MAYVYFLRPIGHDGPIKIGHSDDPSRRCEAYNAIAPWELEVVGKLAGTTLMERQFHTLFAHLHTHHEWFRAAPELLITLAAINGGAFDPAVLPPAKPLRPRKPLTAEKLEWLSLSNRLRHASKRGVVVPREISSLTYGRWNVSKDENDRRRLALRDWLDREAPTVARAA